MEDNNTISCQILTQTGFNEVKEYLENHLEVVTLNLKLTDDTRQIPQDFFEDLAHLQHLSITGNHLTSLPGTIENLTRLSHL